jgi:phospholipid-binding lipoprotein MlaA
MRYFLLFFLLFSLNNAFAEIDVLPSIFNIESKEESIYDPLERFNRKIFVFNKTIDKYALKPVAKSYRLFVPMPARRSIRDFLANLKEPLSFINSTAQLKFKNSGIILSRFVINSTIGWFGLFDVASKINVREQKEDFGQTLAKYKIGSGPFLIIPLLGPSNLRDFSGRLLDWTIDPVWRANNKHLEKTSTRNSLTTIEVVAKRESLIEALDEIEKTALDEYSVIRAGYSQHREMLTNK